MNDQHDANAWAEPGESTPENEPVNAEASAETNAAAESSVAPQKKWSRAVIAGVMAACFATGAAGYAIGAYATHNDGPAHFLGGGPDGHRGPEGRLGPDGQRPPHPGDEDLNGNGIEDHHEEGFEAEGGLEDSDA